MSRRGVKARKPSHIRYQSEDHRSKNKIRRITKCNGADFLATWSKKR